MHKSARGLRIAGGEDRQVVSAAVESVREHPYDAFGAAVAQRRDWQKWRRYKRDAQRTAALCVHA